MLINSLTNRVVLEMTRSNKSSLLVTVLCLERVPEVGTSSAGVGVALKDIDQDIKQRILAEWRSYILEESREDFSHCGKNVVDIV